MSFSHVSQTFILFLFDFSSIFFLPNFLLSTVYNVIVDLQIFIQLIFIRFNKVQKMFSGVLQRMSNKLWTISRLYEVSYLRWKNFRTKKSSFTNNFRKELNHCIWMENSCPCCIQNKNKYYISFCVHSMWFCCFTLWETLIKLKHEAKSQRIYMNECLC